MLTFFLILLQVVWVDVMLSGDNAVVIALACRGLEGRQKTLGMVGGAGVAITLRILATVFLAKLVTVPYLSTVGAVLLFVVAIKMVWGDDGDPEVAHSDALLRAIGIIAVADFSMSLDNIVAIAAIAQGNYWVIVFGLLLSIAIVMVGARIISEFIGRWPILVWAGGALLGYIAGGLFSTDLGIPASIRGAVSWQVAGAIFVPVFVWLARDLPGMFAESDA